MKNNIRIFAVLAAIMMLAISGVAIVSISEVADATTDETTMNVYIYKEVDGNWTWTVQSVEGYNAIKAIMNTLDYSASSSTIDTTYQTSYVYEGQTYYDINSSYGTITKFMGLANDDETGKKWNSVVLTKTATETNYSWKVTDKSLGWYKPYGDYATLMPAYATANVALYYGTSFTSDMISSLISFVGTNAKDLTGVSKAQGSVYEYKFYLKKTTAGNPVFDTTTVTLPNYTTTTLNNAKLMAGITIIGYGSDAVTALIDAVGSGNVSFTETTSPVPGYQTYGWMDTMFGLGTDYNQSTNVYTYWQSFTSHTGLGDDVNVSAALGTGAYSSLPGAPLVDGSIAFLFQPYMA